MLAECAAITPARLGNDRRGVNGPVTAFSPLTWVALILPLWNTVLNV